MDFYIIIATCFILIGIICVHQTGRIRDLKLDLYLANEENKRLRRRLVIAGKDRC